MTSPDADVFYPTSRWELRRKSDGKIMAVVLTARGDPVYWQPGPEFMPMGEFRWTEDGEPRTGWFSYG